jgi:alkanesulfonate monooxygenase SsuD/methylene tetrahydromethanopterin reductase-like flavin-dependent oxidoreductase (luciferase family)
MLLKKGAQGHRLALQYSLHHIIQRLKCRISRLMASQVFRCARRVKSIVSSWRRTGDHTGRTNCTSTSSQPSPQRTPLLCQAGTSKRGRAFAAKHAEAIFLNDQTKPILARAAREIRTAAKEFGRDPYDIRLFAGATVIVAPTRAEAEDILEDYARHVDQAGQLALLSGWTGIDFSTYQPDQAVQYVESNAIQSMVENFTLRSDRPVRIGDLATLSRVGARSPFVVGSPQDVADELITWAEETDVDGFNLFRLVVPESLNAFVDLVVPELQSRGVYKTAYREGTLREKLFPGRSPRLPATHPAAGFRRPLATSASDVRSDAAE